MACSLHFIVHSPRTCTQRSTYTKFEWLVHHILSFTNRTHTTLRRIQNLNGLSIVFYCSQSVHMWHSDVSIYYQQVWGLLRLAPTSYLPWYKLLQNPLMYRFSGIELSISNNCSYCTAPPECGLTTVAMHAHCLHWPTSTGLLFQRALCRACKFMTGKIVPMEGCKLMMGTDTDATISSYVCVYSTAHDQVYNYTCVLILASHLEKILHKVVWLQ